jgi:hypothetical protein
MSWYAAETHIGIKLKRKVYNRGLPENLALNEFRNG